ncbi:MAG: nucleotidyltransferase domain-containing protein [Dehalococcoidia bacterium]|nr:nucleotidyltransferase domain-containing protein [Dehalococcoidia bacterium]
MVNTVGEMKDPTLTEIIRRLVEALQPEQIYLFGSHARGDATAESDYDMLVVVKELADEPFLLERQAYRVLLGMATPMDVVVMSRERFDKRRGVSASLPATVEREGKLLYAA